MVIKFNLNILVYENCLVYYFKCLVKYDLLRIICYGCKGDFIKFIYLFKEGFNL